MNDNRLPPRDAPKGVTPDVCLVLEGTYPFVSGGVSSWVHQIIRGMPELTFALVHVSPHRGFYQHGALYDVPENVLSLRELFLHDYRMHERQTPVTGAVLEKIENFRAFVSALSDRGLEEFERLVDTLGPECSPQVHSWDLLQTPEGWEVLCEAYRRDASDESFLSFFWTWRYIFRPLVNVVSVPVPDAHLFHTVSTGFAGLVAAAAKHRHGRPMMLTEHGIYTRERRIEINRSTWISDWDSGEVVAEHREEFFKGYWIRQFEAMSRVCYESADSIYTLYRGNVDHQIADGAPIRKIRIIPNGIDLVRFGEAAKEHAKRPLDAPFTLGFVGRICPIKDVKTLLYAMRLVRDKAPEARLRLMGPWYEDPEYMEECTRLVRMLDLEGCAVLEGPVNVLAELPHVDALALTSISEAQPLVILEAGAVGLPVVATDVGSCRELLFGRTLSDRRFGPGGFVTPIASPGATAEAVLELIADRAAAREMGRNLQARVLALYDQQTMIKSYRAAYGRFVGARPVAASPESASPESGSPKSARPASTNTVGAA